MFETVDGHYRVRCDRCREAVQDLPTPATAPIEDAKAAARLECHLDSQDRMFCIRCQFVGDSVIGASVTEPPAYCLDALPKRFLDLHFMEFASWSLISDRPRVFRLRWPSRAQRLEADSTIRLDRRIAIRYGRQVIEVFIPDEHDRLTLDRYIAAIKSEDARYASKEVGVMLGARVVTALNAIVILQGSQNVAVGSYPALSWIGLTGGVIGLIIGIGLMYSHRSKPDRTVK